MYNFSMMQYSLHLTESCAKIPNKNLREDISPTVKINAFIFRKDVLELIDKHGMNV